MLNSVRKRNILEISGVNLADCCETSLAAFLLHYKWRTAEKVKIAPGYSVVTCYEAVLQCKHSRKQTVTLLGASPGFGTLSLDKGAPHTFRNHLNSSDQESLVKVTICLNSVEFD